MKVKIEISAGEVQAERYSWKRSAIQKEFDFNLPDNTPLPEIGAMVQSMTEIAVIEATELERLEAEQKQEEEDQE